MTTESYHSEFKVFFRIEQRPDGTFVAKSEQPPIEISGATREEIERKVQEKLQEMVAQQVGVGLPGQFGAATGDGLQITVNKRFNVTDLTSRGTSGGPAELSGTVPITAAPIDAGPSRAQSLFKALLGLIVLLALAWWFFHR
jgi:hypothetical protein